MTLKYIQKEGKKYALLPEKEFKQLLDRLEELEDLQSIKEARSSNEEHFPSDVVFRILDGEQPIKVFREYRQMTQEELATKAKISRNYVSMLEAGKRQGTKKMLTALAKALDVSLEDII